VLADRERRVGAIASRHAPNRVHLPFMTGDHHGLVVTEAASSAGNSDAPALIVSGIDVCEIAAAGAARLFKALGDPVRVQLLALVAQAASGGVCFRDLADAFDMPQPSLSHHLKILVTAGVLERERKGTWSRYRVVEDRLAVLECLLRPGGPFRTPSCHCVGSADSHTLAAS
jgi:ArsR family transcriptional regulator, arsenate/arsenite/antimonite-responsive transcriptional repressor